ncbi:MAG: 30S ribosomal protein S3 [Shimia sp.]|uniref:Small ribosomal subunit protein uS3 n=1 Tax=Shimia sagamensis TaxID=1566352 RepID=A0ABY1NW13_9RHOB|nr:30S ribosomal protein S3 [Shimia sagamensis]MCP4206882.1 30S ribosomal protein S3 [Shimia sp.]MCP4824974.1 30S ribosomal protein S3 [Shimia sp.]SMP18772.1 SSU ribosomal protein S3P [Shimia sagamensis]|mmetsp:Transcript_25926/g.33158  ORF Transcript_25926/g.33158 Transcript_25926/m.33158 type:complete len:236 (-) Transcript_25926:507-1214(-)
MGNKVNPIGMRLQVNRTWDSRWYADTKDFGDLLLEDIKIREFIKTECKQAGIARVIIERPHKKCRVTVHTARPGVIIGKKGADIETLRKKIAEMTDSELHLNIVEVRKPELDATLVGESIAQQLERRVSFRRAMKRAVQNAMRMGALGIRVNVAGRLGGAEIARTEWYREGRVPLHTLRADIDYAHVEATTAYGIIGIKTWIFKGEIMEHDPQARDRRAQEVQDGPAPRGAGGRR